MHRLFKFKRCLRSNKTTDLKRDFLINVNYPKKLAFLPISDELVINQYTVDGPAGHKSA